MSIFEQREKSFEARFSHDQELVFRARNRRNRLVGLWAAEVMGLSGTAAQSYAHDVIIADFDASNSSSVHRKVLHDLQIKGIKLSEHRLQRKIEHLYDVAYGQIMTESESDQESMNRRFKSESLQF